MTTKLIEVALPLTIISEATAAEKRKTARLAHPANIHLWWARRPLAASRAVVFAQLVDDPSAHPERFPTPLAVETERERLFVILRALVEPSGPTVSVLAEARAEIKKCIGDNVTLLDPFAGGGSIPIEARRLGLHVEASDLNPVAVLLNRLLLTQLQHAYDKPAVCKRPDRLTVSQHGAGLSGLAEDVEFYGGWLHEKLVEQLTQHYPPLVDDSGRTLPVIAWIWARTVPCPNPACRRIAPLMSTFWLSKKNGRLTWLSPKVGKPGATIEFDVVTGKEGPADKGSKVGRGTNFRCVGCGVAIEGDYVKESGQLGRIHNQLVAIVALGDRRRVYFPADSIHASAANMPTPDVGSEELAPDARAIWVRNYGLVTHASLFTPRQLTTLATLAGLLSDVRRRVGQDSGDDKYADLVTTVLGICVSKLADTNNSLVTWLLKDEVPAHLFARHAIPMVWDFVESNPLGTSSGSFLQTVRSAARNLTGPLCAVEGYPSVVTQQNAATRDMPKNMVVTTDPPYFDNIGYADLADFFYIWLRLGLRDVHPDLFATLLTPKAEELVATPYRFGGNQDIANRHFESGFREVFARVKERHHPDIPMTVFYAYKQEDEETGDDAGGSGAGATGWEKLLQGMVDSGLQITATWPIRTEMATRMIGMGTNSLASSVVLACRPRPENAGLTDRQGFIRHLRRVLGQKLVELHSGGVQPVDMAQASIGPGMAVFTSYARVLDGAERSLSVGTALQIINQILDELQSEQEGEFDSDTRWAVSWFEQFGMSAGDFGDALNVATARGTAMNALERAGIIESRAGRVRLLARSEYAIDWDPATDKRPTVWEVCQHLIRRIEGDGGLTAAASLLRQVGGRGDAARDLAYRLYEIANRKGWADEARSYNNLAAEWPDLVALAAQAPSDTSTLF